MSVSVDVRHHQNAAARVAHKHVVAIVDFILSQGGRCVWTKSSAVSAVEVKKDFLNAAVELIGAAADVANNNAREAASRFANDLVAGFSDLLVGLSDSHLLWGLWLRVAPLPMFKV